MARLYGNLLKSAGQRYYYGLDSVPGIVSPSVATLTLQGRDPSAAQNIEVFRTPATAILTLVGQSLASPTILVPAQAVLSTVGQIPAEVRELTISPALPAPVYDPPADLAPTLITIWTTQPTTGLVRLLTLEQNVTQGGNIGFVSPATGQVSLGTLQYTLLLLAGGAGVGSLVVNGLAPTLSHELTVTPDVGLIVTSGGEAVLTLPFIWVDDERQPPTTWITDAAA